uniref:Uncharacterized protein n=1 Tax=Zea mays TaxID=4577 RepID=B4FC46_MAIZE|nr:unknown [Zea mays]
MYLWRDAFWDPHRGLDIHLRRRFFFQLTYFDL